MEAVEIIKLVSELGFLVVAAGMLLFMTYKMFTKQQDQFETMLKNALPTHPSSEDVTALNIINDKIYQELQGLRFALKADRVYLFLYHNGGVSSSGLYFQKMSCICEVVNSGILPLNNERQGLYRASYNGLCEQLGTTDEYIVPDVTQLQGKDDFLYQQLRARHSEASYFRALRITKGDVVGFIGIDYCSLKDNVSDSEIHKLMKTVATKVTALVDVRDEI